MAVEQSSQAETSKLCVGGTEKGAPCWHGLIFFVIGVIILFGIAIGMINTNTTYQSLGPATNHEKAVMCKQRQDKARQRKIQIVHVR